MNLFSYLHLELDAFLISFFRMSEHPVIGYFFGSFVLAFLCAWIGRLTFATAARLNREWIHRDSAAMIENQNLSVYALLAKNKAAYKALNKEANDAFGKFFFMQIALAASSLWPLAFALAWMQTRFHAVDFLLPAALPGLGQTVGYTFTFIPLYVLAVILVGKLHQWLFKRGGGRGEVAPLPDMISITDFHRPPKEM